MKLKNRTQIFAVFIAIVFAITGCANEEKDVPEKAEIINASETALVAEQETMTEKKDMIEEVNEIEELEKLPFSFEELRTYQFWFFSISGEWSRGVNINPDGSFYGSCVKTSYYADAGEAYPYGTVYMCDFTGQFTQPVWINDYTYSVQISELNYEKEVGTEEILNGVRYCYISADEIKKGEKFLIYLPGTPLAALPDDFRMWIEYFDAEGNAAGETTTYVLHSDLTIFSGCDVVEELTRCIRFFEQEAEIIEKDIQNESYTQLEYNQKTKELYDLWDVLLNEEWRVLKRILSEEEMNELTDKQREWIARKEQEVKRAGSGCEGSLARPMLMNQRAAELTKERVYELLYCYMPNNARYPYGFSSFDLVKKLRQNIEAVEQLEKDIQNESYTQLEYNQKTKELYDLWDVLLNEEWGILKRILSEEEMNELTDKQREWITRKEQEVKRAGSGCEDSSAQPMLMNQRAAELTKERVYELLELCVTEKETKD